MSNRYRRSRSPRSPKMYSKSPRGRSKSPSRSPGGRYILVVRHGTKQELFNRYDLPICSSPKRYCQDTNVFNKLRQIKKSPNRKAVYASPFLRTKQTAGRLSKKINYEQPIYLVDGLGESYSAVDSQLRKCGERRYRVPQNSSNRIDRCMRNLSPSELNKLTKAQSELSCYKFSPRIKSPTPRNARQQDIVFKKSVNRILRKNPNKDIIIVTHGRNVSKSAQNLSPRRGVPRLTMPPFTCGSILFKQEGKEIKIVDSKGVFTV